MTWHARFANAMGLSCTLAVALVLMLPAFAVAATVANPLCPENTALFNASTGRDIILSSSWQWV